MFKESRTLKNLVFGAVLAILPLFAGCGGGGGDDSSASNNDSSPGTNPVVCVLVYLLSGGTACASSSSSSPTSMNSSSSLATATTSQPNAISELRLQQNDEFEPNSDLMNANLPSYAARTSTDQEIGWFVVGSINDVSDITDAFAFTPLQSREYVVALCPPEGSSCGSNNGIDTLTAFFRLLDQDGNVLQSSEADTENGNTHRMTLDAGVLYYLTVDAGDTMGVTVDYRLFVYEAS